MKISPNYQIYLDPEIWDLVITGTPDQRKFICSREPLYFCLYYFEEFFEYTLDDFHYNFIEDFRLLITLEYNELLWIAFRESGKTTLAKILLTWVIVFAHKRYISYGSYVSENSENALFDIIVWLQTNKRIIKDFGFLYRRMRKKNEIEEAEQKQKSKFVTNNRVRVIAFTTQESTRGHIFGKFRPDLYVYDDIENNKTKDSHAITGNIISHLEEARSGIPSFGSMLYLGNYIRDDGTIQMLKDNIENSVRGVVRNIPVAYEDGTIAWSDKYVESIKEASKLNELIDDPRRRKVAIEQKRIDLGDAVFFTEMMNNPGRSGDYYFDREKVREAMKKARPPIKKIGSFEIWEDYNPAHRYALGADTGEGIGLDSHASAVINFSTLPNRIVGTFADNQINQLQFGHEIGREGRIFGECLIVPEINNGYGTTGTLVSSDEGMPNYQNVWIREVLNKTTKRKQSEFGFRMSTATKPEAFAQFKSAFEDGHLEILDMSILVEMLYYRKADASRPKPEKGTTRHFDKLTASVLAYVGRNEAMVKNDSKYLAPKNY